MGRRSLRPVSFCSSTNLANELRSKEKGAALCGGPRPEEHPHELVAIVIVVIPIAIGMPAAAVFIPPAMPLVPAAFPRLVQFVPRMIRLPAVPSVILDGFVQPMIRLGDAPLALIVVVGRRSGCSREYQHSQKRRLHEQD